MHWPSKIFRREITTAKKELRDFDLAFTGERVQVDKLEGAPAWIGDKAWKQQVKKVGIDKLEEV